MVLDFRLFDVLLVGSSGIAILIIYILFLNGKRKEENEWKKLRYRAKRDLEYFKQHPDINRRYWDIAYLNNNRKKWN